jgi:hypothetical protein
MTLASILGKIRTVGKNIIHKTGSFTQQKSTPVDFFGSSGIIVGEN